METITHWEQCVERTVLKGARKKCRKQKIQRREEETERLVGQGGGRGMDQQEKRIGSRETRAKC